MASANGLNAAQGFEVLGRRPEAVRSKGRPPVKSRGFVVEENAGEMLLF